MMKSHPPLKRDALCAVFLIIKRFIDQLQKQEEAVCYSEFPYVDILEMAEKMGIVAIEFAPPKSFKRNEHAYLDKEKATIYINERDSEEQQRFSIAHELFHFFLYRENLIEELALNPPQKKIIKELVLLNADSNIKNRGSGNKDEKVEVLADYFASNLLVPIERLTLWEDKNIKEIAKAFDVTEKCIKRRKEEIKSEIGFMLS
jgi:Zn-dependent peptidase ImmA (M78 family)